MTKIVFLRIYAVIPASIEEIITFSVQKPTDILRILHHKDLPSHFVDWLIKKGLERFSNKQALLEFISSKISYRNLHLLTSLNEMNIVEFFFDNIEMFIDLPDYTFEVSEGKYDVEVGEILVNSSTDLVKLIKDKGFVHPSPIFVVPLFSLITNFNQLNRCLPDFNTDDGIYMKEITAIFKESQNILSLPEFNIKKFETITEWFAWIVTNQKITEFLKQWKYLKEINSALFASVQSVLILFGLFPFVVEDEEKCDILFDIIRLSCNETNESLIVNFHLCHYSTSSTQIKRKLFKNLSKIKFNDILTKQILRFCYSSSQVSDISVDVYDAVATIFKRHDWIFFENDFQLMIDLPRAPEATVLKDAKFKLLKLACLTESGEKLIQRVIGWIRERPDLLKDAVECITNLSSIEMIEIEKLRSINIYD
uniref:Uncharacterized protein n=1 Tax=Panagrolaimus superbus TaxID=310955 RepID=A0A914ZA58_9BILA